MGGTAIPPTNIKGEIKMKGKIIGIIICSLLCIGIIVLLICNWTGAFAEVDPYIYISDIPLTQIPIQQFYTSQNFTALTNLIIYDANDSYIYNPLSVFNVALIVSEADERIYLNIIAEDNPEPNQTITQSIINTELDGTAQNKYIGEVSLPRYQYLEALNDFKIMAGSGKIEIFLKENGFDKNFYLSPYVHLASYNITAVTTSRGYGLNVEIMFRTMEDSPTVESQTMNLFLFFINDYGYGMINTPSLTTLSINNQFEKYEDLNYTTYEPHRFIQNYFTIYNNVYDGIYTNGYKYGYTTGQEQGQQIGYDKGYEQGREAGYNDGVLQSYDEKNALTSAKIILGSIVDVLNIRLFGFLSVVDLIGIVVVLGLVGFILKFVRS